MTVVVVDDNYDIRLLLRMALPHFGIEVVGEAADGHLGILEVSALQPDAVVLDMMMPRMGGSDALPGIRAACPSARVVLYTSSGADVAESLAAGADAVVPKTDGYQALADALKGN